MTRGAARRSDHARGQALVELALVLPLLLLMFMGLVDIGRIVFTYIALEDAVQEGALYASYEPVPASAIIARVRTSSNHAEVTGATVPAPVCTTSPAPGTVTVTASYNLPLLTPVGSQLFGGSIQLSATFIGTNFRGTCT